MSHPDIRDFLGRLNSVDRSHPDVSLEEFLGRLNSVNMPEVDPGQLDVLREALNTFNERGGIRTESEAAQVGMNRFTARAAEAVIRIGLNARNVRNDLNPNQHQRQETSEPVRVRAPAQELIKDLCKLFREEVAGHLGIPWIQPKVYETASAVLPPFHYPAFNSAHANNNPNHQQFRHMFNTNTRLEIAQDIKMKILSEWLAIKDMGRLDSALTNISLRPAFLATLKGLRSKSFSSYHYGSLPLLRWVGYKGFDIRDFDATFSEVKEGDTPLLWACQNNELDIVSLLCKGTDINTPTYNRQNKNLPGGTPIHFACNGRNVALVIRLLSSLALNVAAKDALGRTALHLVIAPTTSGEMATENILHIAAQLLARNSALATAADNTGFTPMMSACALGQLDLVELMIHYSHENPCKMLDKKGKSCLYYACSNGHSAVVHALVRAYGTALAAIESAAAAASSSEGSTSVHAACASGQADIVRLLLHNVGVPFLQDRKGKSPLHMACEGGNIDIARLLLELHPSGLDITDKENNTALHIACQSGHVHIASMLLEEFKLPVNARNKIGYTALHYAVSRGNYECAHMLVTQGGAFVDAQGTQGSTPLIIACFKNYVDIARMLIRDGCAQTHPMCNMGSALSVAVGNGNFELVQLLINDGHADVDLLCQDGSTCLHTAASKCHADILQCLLVDGHALPDLTSVSDGQTALHKVCALSPLKACEPGKQSVETIVGVLLAAHGNPDVVDLEGRTALHHAVENKHYQAAMVLLQHGSNPDMIAFNGDTPLTLAIENGAEEFVESMLNLGISDVHMTNMHSGATPLHYAARKGSRRITRALLKAGANVDAVDNEGSTSLMAAVFQANQDAIRVLIESGANTSLRNNEGKLAIDYAETRAISNMLV